MKRYIILALLFFIPLLGLSDDFKIDERKSDIYFANGVLTTDKDADENLKLISDLVFTEQYMENMDRFEKELNFKKAYNQTTGFAGDFYESYKQLANENDGWGVLESVINTALMFAPGAPGKIFGQTVSLWDDSVQRVHDADLSKQIASYRQSIRAGHGVIVVAHSQGNLFTNEAYKKFTKDEGLDGEVYRKNDWLNQYFTRISIASPSSIKEGGDVHISFHNDPVVQLSSFSQVENPNKAYLKNAVGEIFDNDALSADFHAFTYYMGEKSAVGSGIEGVGIHGTVSTDVAKKVIMKFLKDEIQTHQTRASQWETRPELESDKGTKEYKITVEHKYGDAVLTSKMKDEKVFPFAPYAAGTKFYQVPDTTGTLHYVKASYGGERILSADDVNDWEAEDNQFYKLEGTDPVEYIEGETSCKDPSLFEVVSQENENTTDWRVTVKNKETNETTGGVYPFNLQGSLYQLDSGDWVLASCGGTEIVSNWDNQKEYQIILLNGTSETLDKKYRILNKHVFINNFKPINNLLPAVTLGFYEYVSSGQIIREAYTGDHTEIDAISKFKSLYPNYIEETIHSQIPWRTGITTISTYVSRNGQTYYDCWSGGSGVTKVCGENTRWNGNGRYLSGGGFTPIVKQAFSVESSRALIVGQIREY